MIKLQESGEMYLETILVLKNKIANVRSIDIANELGFSKPSVSRAVSILKSNDYITVNSLGYISLTEKGSKVANTMLERHNLLSKALIMLGVDKEIATRDACRIEHVISEQSFDKIKDHIKNLNGNN